MHVIAIANQKGGVGKTTTTINLGTYLVKHGHSVLIVDLDPQGNTTSGLGINKQAIELDLYHALHDHSLTEDILIMSEHGVAVLPASPVLSAAEVELVNLDNREFRLKKILERLSYDYVLIDCPPSLGLLTLNGLSAAQHVLIPVQAEYYALEGLSQLTETIGRVKQALNPELDLLGVLLTMHDSRTTLSGQVHDEVKKHFPGKVFDTIIPRNIRLAEAPSHGQPISSYSSVSKGARSYAKLAKEVKKRTGGKNG